MSKYNRADATFGAYAAALGIIVLVLGVMALVVNGRSQEHIPSVDYGADVGAVRAAAPYPVPVPKDLPKGWVPTSTKAELPDADAGEGAPVGWTLGFATPKDRHAELSVSNADSAEFVAERTGKGTADGSTDVRGATWERFDAPRGRHALVLRGADSTTVVSGSTDYAELSVLAESLDVRE